MTIEKRIFSLPSEHMTFIDQMVTNGNYATASEVVRAGLRALQERDTSTETWLAQEVAPAYDAIKEDPDRGMPADQVFSDIRRYHAERQKAHR